MFTYKIINPNNNSAQNCLSQCSDFGYPVGGMEYGDECCEFFPDTQDTDMIDNRDSDCGDPVDLTNAKSTKQSDTVCNMPCSGDARYLCGSGNLLSLYRWTGTPLYTWQMPQGSAAGVYQLLIGGVVVPLMTSQMITGKVTFLEKHGTGAANSTGAYELDVSKVNNFASAWRTMNGLKTDVFCSAGLILPDKVGRQINVGGWSESSTFGVRLYWPGGPSNDWQENVAELTLQYGRWYPSAIIMANGSILVVGGETGSNAGPVPSLEILPNPINGNSVVYLDFLNRTDPYNLYPFLAVLPSGGVFIAYYNEARILDDRTFATTKQLPNIPGSVNNFESGRTYPLEGSAVLLPQHAPYSDPLTVLICGGSSPYAGIALDNCVSTQPELASPKWTLERMPSQRVMPCVSTLPDGTFLILNGAHQGTAGFGLATSPNLNALLYDPSLPVGSRFSIMNNTTVARLYHSEAILLQDGRVMVSGSDPQDNVHPEEYRVEVFVPPYLLSGLPQPSYTIQNKDWAYGSTVSITVTSGSTASLRVSLLGAESSTHGNSMGQRILFPAVSCHGSTCVITAPPDAHVCPPGWFQLFVLDGPTPSRSTFVRIGGDPAGLGSWPRFKDFDTTGV